MRFDKLRFDGKEMSNLSEKEYAYTFGLGRVVQSGENERWEVGITSCLSSFPPGRNARSLKRIPRYHAMARSAVRSH